MDDGVQVSSRLRVRAERVPVRIGLATRGRRQCAANPAVPPS